MKVEGKLTFKGDGAGELINIVTASLAPDNPPDIKTIRDELSATVTFSADKIGTVLSSVDDYLINAKIACDIIRKVRMKN